MVPVNEALPEPLPQLFEKPAFVQARAELKERCSAKATAQTHLLSGMPPCVFADQREKGAASGGAIRAGPTELAHFLLRPL